MTPRTRGPLGTLAIITLSAALIGAQTRITPPKNKYSPQQDVELGLEAAAQARQELPLMRDDSVTSYVDDLGKRLVEGIPPEFGQSAFKYTFETVNIRDINAFALPGGPMFVNRGMIEAASTEGEVAGVMAHEISHVVLRHGTAQVSKAQRFQMGQVAGAILGAVVGGRVGDVIAQGTSFGLGTYFLRYGRDYEKQADLLGAQIMSRVGYDARDMAAMFRTIEKNGGGSGPEWLSSHPNPGNRSQYITKEAESLRIENRVGPSQRFDRVKTHLGTLPKAPSSEELAKQKPARNTGGGATRPPAGNVPPPSDRFRQHTAGNIFRVAVPSNWQESQGSSAVTFAPSGALGSYNGQTVFTHGVEFGFAQNLGRDLQSASESLIDSLSRGNPRMRAREGFNRTDLGGRPALVRRLSNVSEATQETETVQVITAQLSDGTLFYGIAVAPDRDYNAYLSTFERVFDSVRFQR